MPLLRVRYFVGQLLNAADLQAEQEYGREKHRRHNRWLHGVGIAAGLEVSVSASTDGDWAVVVSPGLAIDPAGEELVIEAPIARPLAALSGSEYWLLLRYVESECETVTPVLGEPQASRMLEGVDVSLTTDLDPAAVVVARIVREGDGWALDTGFLAARTH